MPDVAGLLKKEDIYLLNKKIIITLSDAY